MKQVKLEVNGMHCKSCAKIIQDRLSEMQGVESAEASFADETVKVSFDDGKVSREKIEAELGGLGYPVKGPALSNKETAPIAGGSNKKRTIKQGIAYGLVPHIGCIGFIAASILGVTVAVEFFRPLLMNPWFFHILVAISIGFATLSSAIYLRKQGILSFAGVKRKKKYLTTMYGSTVGINLVLFLLVFPMLANLDTGSFAESPTGMAALSGAGAQEGGLLRLQVNIPCPGHAPLISGELKTIDGVTGVRFEFPNYFDVAFSSAETSKEEILSLEVFKTYPAALVSESGDSTAALEAASLQESGAEEVSVIESEPRESYSSGGTVTEVQSRQAAAGGGSCGGSCGGGCGRSSCGCGSR